MKKYILILAVMALAFSFSGCDLFFTGDVKFDNYDNVMYSCFIDGEYQGIVDKWGSLTVYDVSTGSIELKITSGSSGSGSSHFKVIHLTTDGYRWEIDNERFD